MDIKTAFELYKINKEDHALGNEEEKHVYLFCMEKESCGTAGKKYRVAPSV